MKHIFDIQPIPFRKIARGEKVVESRLFDAKRQKISVGDEIEFVEHCHQSQRIRARVDALHRAESFENLFTRVGPKHFGGANPKELLEEISSFYTESDQKKFGVVGIQFEVIEVPKISALLSLSDRDIHPHFVVSNIAQWVARDTVKVVAQNSAGEIALITNAVHQLVLIPGGGIDEGETISEAADRECREEIGWSLKSYVPFGMTEEYRGRDGKHTWTYGVSASIDQQILEDLRTSNERDQQLRVIWMSPARALELLREQIAQHRMRPIAFYNTAFNIHRDFALLRTWSDLLK